MERSIRLLLMIIAMIFSIIPTAHAEKFLTLPLMDSNPYMYQGWTYNTPLNGTTVHEGIDYDCDLNDPIVAAADGIAMAAYGGGYGNFVRIEHENGMETMYAHMTSVVSSIPYKGNTTSARNDTDYDSWTSVQRGDVIGYCGNTETGTVHLHFELTTGGYGGSCGCRIDPYDIRSTDVDYPDSNTTASCGSDHHWTECPPVTSDEVAISTTASVHLMSVEPNSRDKFNIYGYEVSGSGNTTTLSGDYFQYLNTGNTTTILSWLSGDMDSYQTYPLSIFIFLC